MILLLINQQFHNFLEKKIKVHFHVVIITHYFKINTKKAYIVNAFSL